MCIGYRGIATEILDKLCMSQVNPRSGLAMCDELSHSVLHNVGVPGRAKKSVLVPDDSAAPWGFHGVTLVDMADETGPPVFKEELSTVAHLPASGDSGPSPWCPGC